MDEKPKCPRIWDSEGERKVIGETRVSWVVVNKYRQNDPWAENMDEFRQAHGWAWSQLKEWVELVNKKEPNNQWFMNEADYLAEVDRMKVRAEGSKVAKALDSACWKGQISYATLQQIADLIGYDPESKQ